MAEGIYYTEADYIERWGEQELLRLTDGDGDGVPDSGAFLRAATDASADVDLYLATRYAIPLSDPPPRIVVSITGALTREKLHSQFPTETVTREADLARKQLLDLSNGRATLLLDTGAESPANAAATGSGIMVSTGMPQVFTADKLARY